MLHCHLFRCDFASLCLTSSKLVSSQPFHCRSVVIACFILEWFLAILVYWYLLHWSIYHCNSLHCKLLTATYFIAILLQSTSLQSTSLKLVSSQPFHCKPSMATYFLATILCCNLFHCKSLHWGFFSSQPFHCKLPMATYFIATMPRCNFISLRSTSLRLLLLQSFIASYRRQLTSLQLCFVGILLHCDLLHWNFFHCNLFLASYRWQLTSLQPYSAAVYFIAIFFIEASLRLYFFTSLLLYFFTSLARPISRVGPLDRLTLSLIDQGIHTFEFEKA